MSFILDALRKSDTQRQEQAAPSLVSAQQPGQRPRSNRRYVLLIGVLLLNAAIIAWVYLPDDSTPAPAADTARQDADTATDARSLRREATSVPVTVTTSAPEPQTVTTPQAATSPPVAAVPVVQIADRPLDEPAPTTESTPQPETIQADVPSFQQLTVAGMLSVPTLRLDMHVFAGNSDKRFVFINMNKYREGDRLDEGPVLEEITDTGAILSHQGNRFSLDRN